MKWLTVSISMMTSAAAFAESQLNKPSEEGVFCKSDDSKTCVKVKIDDLKKLICRDKAPCGGGTRRFVETICNKEDFPKSKDNDDTNENPDG